MCQFCNVNTVVDRKISAGDFVVVACPNCISQKTYFGEWDDIFKGAKSYTNVSDISGYKAGSLIIKYEPADNSIGGRSYAVTLDEFKRLVGHGLMPDEYKELVKNYKDNESIDYELHDDFYDESGMAFQPIDDDRYCHDLKIFIKNKQSEINYYKAGLKEIEGFTEPKKKSGKEAGD